MKNYKIKKKVYSYSILTYVNYPFVSKIAQ